MFNERRGEKIGVTEQKYYSKPEEFENLTKIAHTDMKSSKMFVRQILNDF